MLKRLKISFNRIKIGVSDSLISLHLCTYSVQGLVLGRPCVRQALGIDWALNLKMGELDVKINEGLVI